MFLPARDNPWFVKLTSYVAHPEYEFSKLNTIAVIELDLNGVVNCESFGSVIVMNDDVNDLSLRRGGSSPALSCKLLG